MLETIAHSLPGGSRWADVRTEENTMTDAAKKGITFLVIAFALFYLVTQPEGAATAVKVAISAIVTAFDAIIKFFNALAS
jgi:hypothetical protein